MKARKGSAYIFVLIATMSVLIPVLAALIITASSRQLTAYHSNFSDLYNIAAAGNEQVLFLLRENALYEYFVPTGTQYRRDWSFTVNIFSENTFTDEKYIASTIVSPEGDGFTVSTRAAKYTDGVLGHFAEVTAKIVFSNYLDDYAFTMVELKRIAE